MLFFSDYDMCYLVWVGFAKMYTTDTIEKQKG